MMAMNWEKEARSWEARHDEIVAALKEWPKLPPSSVLSALSEAGDFKQDWGRGKQIQSELPIGAVPYVCECEVGAGFWDRITNGAWRTHGPLNPPAKKDTP